MQSITMHQISSTNELNYRCALPALRPFVDYHNHILQLNSIHRPKSRDLYIRYVVTVI